MRIKDVIARATVTGVLIATAGVGAAITATPAGAQPANRCTIAYKAQLQSDIDWWGAESDTWGIFANDDYANGNWDAYNLDVHNMNFALGQSNAAAAKLIACG